jgi:cytochrome P450
MTTYVVRIARERRARPADDLISQLVSIGGGDGLEPIELVQFVTLLLVAGNETTTNLIGNATAALLEHPEQLARVAADPALIPGLIEDGALRRADPAALPQALSDVRIAGRRSHRAPRWCRCSAPRTATSGASPTPTAST